MFGWGGPYEGRWDGLRGEVDVGADAAGAGLCGKLLAVNLVVLAGGAGVAAEVGAGVAAVAVLALQRGAGARARVGVADKHAETLRLLGLCHVELGLVCKRLTGLKAVILPG